jgi:CBS domain-containing protein
MSEDSDDSTSLHLHVRDVMAKEPMMVDCNRTVKETAIAMDRSGHGCLLVTAEDKVVGIITERDLVRRALTKGGAMSRSRIKNIMSAPLIVVDPEASIEQAAKIMAHHKIRRLPVVGKSGPTGLITITDIARYLAEHSDNESPLLNAITRSNNQIYA